MPVRTNHSRPAPTADPRSGGNVALIIPVVLAVAALVVFVGGMVLMALSMGDHMNGMMGGRAGSTPQTPVVADQPQTTVEIRDFEYFPRELTVEAGSRVTWVNLDAAPHTATAKGEWDTGTLNQNDSKTLTFDTPGTYEYLCAIHPSMKATLTVR